MTTASTLRVPKVQRDRWIVAFRHSGAKVKDIARAVGLSRSQVMNILRAQGIHRPTAEQRFHRKYRVDPETGCWVWTAGVVPPNPKRRFPYANFFWGGRNGYAHRFAYELANGPIPDGLEIDHLCRNTLCVNHEHLEAVGHIVNVRRGELMKTHCKRGHSLTEGNLYRHSNRRRCRACTLMGARERRLAARPAMAGAPA
jgi:hypothetical protein